jgi:SSS family solute:Na+ symporter
MIGAGVVLVSLLVFADAGWSGTVAAIQAKRGAAAFNPFSNPTMGPMYVLWQALTQIAVVITWQTMIQRVLSSRDSRTARRMYTTSSFYYVGRFLIPAFWGMGALAMLPAVDMNSLHAMPAYLARLLPAGLIGIVVAAMLAAEMSTDSGYLLTWSSILFNDIVRPARQKPFSHRSAILLNRVLLCLMGSFLLLYGLWYEIPGRAWDYLVITGNIYLSSISVLVVACCYWPRATSVGAMAAIAGGALAPLLFLSTNIFATSEAAGLMAFATAALGMIVGSLVSRPVRVAR